MNENLKLVATAGIELAMYGVQVFEDGKLTAMEGFGFLPKLMAVPGLLEKKEEIKKEWNERTTESMADLNLHIQNELKLPNQSTEAKVEKGVTAILAILDLVDEFKKPAIDAGPQV